MYNNHFEANTFKGCDNVVINSLVGSVSYALAKQYKLAYLAYTDENIFFDQCEMMKNKYEGYLGFCSDEHGDIEYLTVYEPSCEQDGYIIGVCEYCSAILEEKHIEAKGHIYETTVSIPATENTPGVEKRTCKNCGDSFTDYTPATDENAQAVLCNVSGTVVIANSETADSGVTPLKSVNVKINDEIIATTNADGTFSFDIETGVYEVTFSYNYGFDRTAYLVVGNNDVDMDIIPVIACDFNKDGKINDGDTDLFKFVISSSVGDSSYLDYVDMNGDGVINVKDLIYMNSFKGLDSASFVYPNIVIGA